VDKDKKMQIFIKLLLYLSLLCVKITIYLSAFEKSARKKSVIYTHTAIFTQPSQGAASNYMYIKN
jgi:hypothetical protein